MPRKRAKKTKLGLFAEHIAEGRRIIDAQQTLLEKLRVAGAPTHEAEAALRTYACICEQVETYTRCLDLLALPMSSIVGSDRMAVA
jgi:hypothetical protein